MGSDPAGNRDCAGHRLLGHRLVDPLGHDPLLLAVRHLSSRLGFGAVDSASNRSSSSNLEPAVSLETAVQEQTDAQDHPENYGITPLPRQFGHVLEVHPIDAASNG